jgi:molecular chaperone IbpA
MLFETMFSDFYSKANTPSRKYVPYNLVKLEDDKFALEFNVAGMNEDELNIEVKNRRLCISGNSKKKDNKDYIVNHWSLLPFNIEFTLQEQVEVESAKFKNGILTVNLELVVPEEKKPKKISITH